MEKQREEFAGERGVKLQSFQSEKWTFTIKYKQNLQKHQNNTQGFALTEKSECLVIVLEAKKILLQVSKIEKKWIFAVTRTGKAI